MRRHLPTLLLLCAGLLSPPAWAAPAALVTILEGEATLLRGNGRFALTEGVALESGDIVETGATTGLLRLEYADGASLGLGPAALALVTPQLSGARAGARAYLLRGWAKLSRAGSGEALLLSPAFDASTQGHAVLSLGPDRAFAETGALSLRRGAAAAVVLKGGEFAALGSDGKLQTAARPTADFIQQLPRPFYDVLPPRAAQFKGKERTPKRLADLRYADARPWLNAPDAALRRAYLPRWRPLIRNAEFRQGLAGEMPAHPEWQPILFPPPPPASAARTNPIAGKAP